MKLKLWTIQEENKIDEISSNGKLICTSNNYSKEWNKEYLWMVRQMKNRIGNPKVKEQYPIWAWYQHQDSNKPKTDLRKSGHLPSETKGIRIEFEKKENEVLLSDFVLWHFPLCYKSIIASNEQDANKFESKLKRLKLDKLNFAELPKKVQQEIEISWDRIFDMNFEKIYYAHPKNEKKIQACCWEIRAEEILKIDKFTAR